jgi:hypothetical protein
VALDFLHDSGGIGLFTTTGLDASGRHPLVGQFNSEGQSGSGANAGITGTFVTFRTNWEQPTTVPLWSKIGLASNPSSAVMAIQTTQTMATASVAPTDDNSATIVSQVKQQLTVTFINGACREVLLKSGESCQIQYLFTLGIERSGVKDWNKVDWFQVARLLIDPAQGNMPVIDAPVGQKGEITLDTTRNFELFISGGEPTGHTTFKNRRFDISLNFHQFENALRIAVAGRLKMVPTLVTPDDIRRFFGPRWDDMLSWALLSVEVGQEVYNSSSDLEAHIGGSFSEIAISAEK